MYVFSCRKLNFNFNKQYTINFVIKSHNSPKTEYNQQ